MYLKYSEIDSFSVCNAQTIAVCLRTLLCISYLENKTLSRCGSRSTSFWVHRNLFWHDNCQGAVTCMVWACHTPRQPLQIHPSGHLGGWATPWSAEEMLDRQHYRVNIRAHARIAHKGLLQKRPEEDLYWIVPHPPPPTPTRRPNRSRVWTELTTSHIMTGDIWAKHKSSVHK